MSPPRKASMALATALLLTALAVLALWLELPERVFRAPPDFGAIADAQARKEAFFNYLGPLVQVENEAIADERRQLLALADKGDPGLLDRWQLDRLARKYLSEEEDDAAPDAQGRLRELLVRVDTIPVSLALAQGAKESGWGRARFAVEGNNYFGQRCWEPGCGMLPRDRAPGRRHEVDVFATPRASVAGYLLNLNTHPDYAELRAYRAELRARGEPVLGTTLAERLLTYSERGEPYIAELQSLIQFNQLEQRF